MKVPSKHINPQLARRIERGPVTEQPRQRPKLRPASVKEPPLATTGLVVVTRPLPGGGREFVHPPAEKLTGDTLERVLAMTAYKPPQLPQQLKIKIPTRASTDTGCAPPKPPPFVLSEGANAFAEPADAESREPLLAEAAKAPDFGLVEGAVHEGQAHLAEAPPSDTQKPKLQPELIPQGTKGGIAILPTAIGLYEENSGRLYGIVNVENGKLKVIATDTAGD